MAAPDAVEFLIEDHGDKGSGFRQEFADDKPCRSILQRQDKDLSEVLKLFDWSEDDSEWIAEYGKDKPENMKLIRYRRRVSFCIGGWREFNEDFGRGDVSCLRDIRTPLVTSRSPLKAMKDEFDESN